jgi:hypothetical protein
LSVGFLLDELAVDVAGVEIGRGNRHDRRRHQRADADRGEGDADEPGRKAVQEQRRHGKIVAELFEAVGVVEEVGDAGGDSEEADQRQEAEHERIARQHRRVAADGMPAARAQNAGERMRIEKERQRRAERERGVDAVGAGGVGPRRRQQELLRRHGSKDLAEAAQRERDDDDGGGRGDVDQNVLDDGDRGWRAQPAREEWTRERATVIDVTPEK